MVIVTKLMKYVKNALKSRIKGFGVLEIHKNSAIKNDEKGRKMQNKNVIFKLFICTKWARSVVEYSENMWLNFASG